MKRFEQFLLDRCDELQPSMVCDAMKYSLLAPGKRLRPLLLFNVIEGYQLPRERGYYGAAALEMIHTYSLIHDDLPALDNDVLRRGKNTCHVEFNEACAILAGDGLLTYAFEMISKASDSATINNQCCQLLAKAAGASGMVYGQILDMTFENKQCTWSELETLHENKTGQLFKAALQLGALLADKPEDVEAWGTIGIMIGLAFQIQDDILDVVASSEQLGKSNSDVTNNKSTSVTILGLEEAQRLMNELYDKAISFIKEIHTENTSVINTIETIRTRNK